MIWPIHSLRFRCDQSAEAKPCAQLRRRFPSRSKTRSTGVVQSIAETCRSTSAIVNDVPCSMVLTCLWWVVTCRRSEPVSNVRHIVCLLYYSRSPQLYECEKWMRQHLCRSSFLY